jgi:hypothetical protein
MYILLLIVTAPGGPPLVHVYNNKYFIFNLQQYATLSLCKCRFFFYFNKSHFFTADYRIWSEIPTLQKLGNNCNVC